MKSQSILLFLLIAAFQLSAQNVLTLDIALDQALENNYNIKIARNNKEIADNNYSLGNAGFLPSINANFDKSFGNQSFDRELASGTLQSQSNAKNERTTYGASLNWTIFDGMKMFTTYDQLSELNQQSEESLKAEIELLVYNITSTFYLAALEKERLTRYDSNVLLSDERLSVAKDKYELGKASKLEFLQAQVDLNADKSLRIQQQQQLALRKYELARLMADYADSIDFTLQFELVNDDNLNLSDLLENLEAQNPVLTAAKREKAIADYNAKINKGDRLPVVGLNAGYVHSKSITPAGFALENTSSDITYGLTASWTIFNGFNVNRRIQNAKIQSENSEYQYNNQLLDFNTAIKSRYIDYKNSLELMALESENLSVARENNEISKARYEIGLSTALELREAQINFLDAELRFQNAAFNAKLAAIELKYLSGTSLR
ncbi:MAG TPA: TolC family protein [Fulvivirga sp.]|nr:TolC family protein [Fulvivirga sp.]